MSAYTEVECAFQDHKALIYALEEVYGKGNVVTADASSGRPTNSIPLFGYEGRARVGYEAGIVIRRQHVGGAANDLGFRWNGREWVAIISQFDSRSNNRMAAIKEAYTAEATRNILRRRATWVEKRNARGELTLDAQFHQGRYRHVIITIDRQGTANVDLVGGRGHGCLEFLKTFQTGLGGKVRDTKLKPSFSYLENTITQVTHIGGPLCG